MISIVVMPSKSLIYISWYLMSHAAKQIIKNMIGEELFLI